MLEISDIHVSYGPLRALKGVSLSRARTVATQIANQRMEFVRATKFDNIENQEF